VGLKKVTAWGKVYNLKKLTDIDGTYAAVGGGGSAVAMKNANGVVIDLYTTSEGVSFSLGTGGVTIELKQ
jgi:hypothetical protein